MITLYRHYFFFQLEFYRSEKRTKHLAIAKQLDNIDRICPIEDKGYYRYNHDCFLH